MKERSKKPVLGILGIIAFLLFLIPIGFYLSNPLILDEVSLLLIYGIFALSIDLLWGYMGILSFGQAAFFGLGAYTMAWVTKGLYFANVSMLGILLGIMVPMAIGFVLSLSLFFSRIRGMYFTIITLAFAAIAENIAVAQPIFGGYDGLFDIPPIRVSLSKNLIGSFSGGLPYYYIVLSMLFLVYMVCRRIVNSPLGMIFASINFNEERAESFGLNTAIPKTLAFTVAAGIAGFAGALYVPEAGLICYQDMGVVFSTQAVIWVALGGRGTLIGAIVGAILVKTLSYILSDIMATYWLGVLGLLFILCVTLFPEGIMGWALKRHRRRMS